MDNPEDAAKRMALRQRISPAEVLASYDGIRLLELRENKILLTGESPKLKETSASLVEYMLERKLLRKTFDVSDIIDARFLPHE